MTESSRKDGIKGTDRLVRRLAWLRRSAEDEAEGTVAEAAEEVRMDARERLRKAPGGLPRLADDVDVEGEGAEHAVVIRHPAAPFVEYGTRHLLPRPFLQPAADGARRSFQTRMKVALARLLRGRRP